MERARLPLLLTASRLALGPLYLGAVAALGPDAFAPLAPAAAASQRHRGAELAVPLAGALPLALAALASATDFADGRLARRLGAVSARGAALDVAADAAFLLCALAALAAVGALSWSLPAATCASLAALAVRWRGLPAAPPGSSVAPPRRALPDAVGHAAGVLNYGAVLVASAIPLGLASATWAAPASLALAALNLAPIALRALAR